MAGIPLISSEDSIRVELPLFYPFFGPLLVILHAPTYIHSETGTRRRNATVFAYLSWPHFDLLHLGHLTSLMLPREYKHIYMNVLVFLLAGQNRKELLPLP